MRWYEWVAIILMYYAIIANLHEIESRLNKIDLNAKAIHYAEMLAQPTPREG